MRRYAYNGPCASADPTVLVVDEIAGTLPAKNIPSIDSGPCGSGKRTEVVGAQFVDDSTSVQFAAMPRDSTSQYLFLTRSNGERCEVVRVTKATCSVEIFDERPSCQQSCSVQVATTASRAVVVDGEQVFAKPLEGGLGERLSVTQSIQLLAADSTHVYGLTADGVDLVRLGSEFETLTGLQFGLYNLVHLSLGDSDAVIGGFYPSLGHSQPGILARVDLRTNTLQILMKQSGAFGFSASLFGDYIYYSDGGVVRVAKQGGQHTRIISERPDAGVASEPLGVDESGIYFNVNYSTGTPQEDALGHANLDGSDPKLIAPRSVNGSFSLDETHIYWVSEQGDLLRMLKPGR